MRDAIILAGGFNLQGMGASALRALGLAQLFQALGYRVVVLGKFGEIPEDDSPFVRDIDGIPCRDIRRPLTGPRPADYVVSADSVMAMADHLGPSRVRAVLCYNYPARGAWSIIRGCQRRGIAPILDCTEWYGWEGRKILRNLHRQIGVQVRMRFLTRLSGNVVCASSWFQRRMASQHTVLLPFVLDTAQPRWVRTAGSESGIPRLVYSGLPGVGMFKDRLPVMIGALASLVQEGYAFNVSIAGIAADDYLSVVPSHAAQLRVIGDRIRFHGRIPHHHSLDLIRAADFSVFFRHRNRVSNTGFPTKYVEAATLGVPVITNATSDLPRYLHDGVNGIMARSTGEADVLDALRRALILSPAERSEMVAACRSRNPFDFHEWLEPAKLFLSNLRGLNEG